MTAERFLFFPVNTHKLKSRYFHKNRKPCAGMTAERFLFFPVNTHKLKSRYFHKNRKPKTAT
ncbi:hypothetical protein SU89_04915 [Neisseria meningitidis]|nr:hypothetical protein [Neisseria meningitidis]